MKIEKPITENMKEKCNKAFLYMKQNNRYITKQELMEVLDISNERSVRDVISTLSHRVSIIATSDNKGYKLVTMTAEDIEAMKHSWREIDSRIAQLNERRKQYLKTYEKAKKIGII